MPPLLTDTAIRALKPPIEKSKKYTDSLGLYVEVFANGSKLWRWKYRFLGKEKRLALGKYPDVGVKEARRRVLLAREKLEKGFDPVRVGDVSDTGKGVLFSVVAHEWVEHQRQRVSTAHLLKCQIRIDKYILPTLGARPVAQIKAQEILALARVIEKTGYIETAHRTTSIVGQILRYATATGREAVDHTPSLRGLLIPMRHKHMPSPGGDVEKVAELLRMTEAFKGSIVVGTALKLLPYLFCRPGELRRLRWADVDFKNEQIVIPAARMKVKTADHVIPLPRQALVLLVELQPFVGQSEYVFPCSGAPAQAMSDAAINAAYRRLGIDTKTELTGHGWRSVARTILHERLKFSPAVIEHQLAHAVPDALGAAYNRTKFLDERREMMQVWADWLDGLGKSG